MTRRTATNALETRFPPAAMVVLAAVLMWWVARMTPSMSVTIPARRTMAALLGLVGLAVIAAGVLQFRRARTTVNPMHPAHASALVESGVYRLTRNPMYLGFAIMLGAWSAYLASPAALLGVVGFVAYMDRFQIEPEERALRASFPAAFDAYSRKVRRWL